MIPDRFRKTLYFLISSLVLFSIFAISYFHILDDYELETLDFRYHLRPQIPTTEKIVMVDIGEDSIEKLGHFPFDRSYHALLVKALSENGAKAIVFDIFFSEPHGHDIELEDAMRKSGKVYLPYVFDIETNIRSKLQVARGYIAKEVENLALASKGMGHINIYPDSDGKFRRVPLYVKYKEDLHPYVSFLMSCDYLGINQKDIKIVPGEYIALKSDLKIPLDERSNMIINFTGRWGQTYAHYSYIDILQSYLAGTSGQKPIIDMSKFKDKVCIIGLTAAGTTDLHPNPFETLYPGVGMHAEIFNSLLTGNFIRRASRPINLLILLILSLIVAFVTMKIKPLKMLPILASVVILLIEAGICLFSYFGIWIDLFYPVTVMIAVYIALTLYRYISEWKKRLVLENELGIAKKIQESFLPKNVPEFEGLDMSAYMFTARQVGGDLYDFIVFGPDRLGVMIGDVSGKGVPASLFMAMVTGKFKFLATQEVKPEDVLFNLNTILSRESASNLFVTVFYCIFNMSDKTVMYSNGGHLPLIRSRSGNPIEFLDVREGTPLGLMEGPYSGNKVSFEKGDTFVFYTDGITEAMNSKSEMYEEERLAAVIESHSAVSSKALIGAIEKDVRKFEPKSKQHDDMTLIVVKIT